MSAGLTVTALVLLGHVLPAAEAPSAPRIGFFADEQPTGEMPHGLPEDPAFDRYLSVDELARAWSDFEAGPLADVAIQAAEGERTLFRGRRGVPTDAVWRLAETVARLQDDRATLERLGQAAERYGRPGPAGLAGATEALSGASREAGSRSGAVVDAREVPPSDFALLKTYCTAIDQAVIGCERQFLADLEEHLPRLFESAAARKIAQDRLAAADETQRGAETEAGLAKSLTLLADASRPFGGIKIGRPKLPKVSIHDINREAKRARETVQREAKNARETVQREGKKARQDIQRESVRAKTGASEEAWGEAGRAAYVAAAGIMGVRYAQRTAQGIPRHDRAVLERVFGRMLNRVELYWGCTPLDEWRHETPVGNFVVRFSGEDTRAQAYGYKIYIRDRDPNALDPQDRLHLLLHELMHVVQYERYQQSLSNFGYHYFKKYKQANLSYANNPMELEAEGVADREIGQVLADYIQRVGGTLPNLLGTWSTAGRSVTFGPGGVATIQTIGGTSRFRFTYDPATGALEGVDGSGQTTQTRLQWLSSDSFRWASPTGTRHYVRERSAFGLRR